MQDIQPRNAIVNAAYIDLNWFLTQNSLPSKHIIVIYCVFIRVTMLHKTLRVDVL